MKRLERIERKGYKVIADLSGVVFAEKNGRQIKANSITELHKKIFGY